MRVFLRAKHNKETRVLAYLIIIKWAGIFWLWKSQSIYNHQSVVVKIKVARTGLYIRWIRSQISCRCLCYFSVQCESKKFSPEFFWFFPPKSPNL